MIHMKVDVLWIFFLILLVFLGVILTLGYLHDADDGAKGDVQSLTSPFEGARRQYPPTFPQLPSEDLRVESGECIDILYDDYVLLRYNTWFDNFQRVNPPDWMFFHAALTLPEDSGFAMPVFYHGSFNLTEEYLSDMMEWFFPDIDLATMNVDFDPPSKVDPDSGFFPKPLDIPYILVENKTCEIELFSDGIISYSVKELPETVGAISSGEEAVAVASAFVTEHGGLPVDAGDPIDWSNWYYDRSYNRSLPWNTTYDVSWSREFANLPITSATNYHHISVNVEPSTGAVVRFRWHWPEMSVLGMLEEVPSINETLQAYGLDPGKWIWPGAANPTEHITSWDLVYLMPDFMEPLRNETVAGNHYYAPYWELTSTDSGRDGERYYIPLIHPAHP